MISFSCPRCKAFLTVDDHQAGSRHACASCGQIMLVPAHARAPHSATDDAGPPITHASASPATFTPAARTSGPHFTAADIRIVKGRQVVFWPCTHCRLGLNTPYENVGLSIHCPGCNEPVTVPDPIAARHRDVRSASPTGAAHPDDRFPPHRRKSVAGLVIALALIGLVLVGGVVALLIWQPWAQKTLAGDQLRYLPDGAQIVATIDVQGVVGSEAYHKLDGGLEGFLGGSLRSYEKMVKEKIGLGWSDIRRLTAGGKLGDKQVVAVVTTIKPFNAREILRRLKQESSFDEISVEGFKVFKPNARAPWGAPSFCITEPTVVVFCPDLEGLKTILTRNKGPLLSADLQAAMSRTDFSRTIAVAVGKPPAEMNGIGALGGNLGGFAGKLEGASIEIDLGANIDFKLTALCSDDKTAKELKDAGTGLLTLAKGTKTMPAELMKVVDAIHLSSSGAAVSVTMSLDPHSVIELAKLSSGGRPLRMNK